MYSVDNCASINSTAVGFSLVILCIMLVYFQKYRVMQAKRGDAESAAMLLLPIYHPIFIFAIFLSIVLATTYLIYPFVDVIHQDAFTTTHFVCMHTLYEGIAFFLLQNSVSLTGLRHAFKQSFLLSISLGSILVGACFLDGLENNAGTIYYCTYVSLYFLLSIFYGILWKAPMNKVPRRPALLHYASWFCCMKA